MPFDNGRGGRYGRPPSGSRGRGPRMVPANNAAALQRALQALAPARGSPGRRSGGQRSYGRPTSSYAKGMGRKGHGYEARVGGEGFNNVASFERDIYGPADFDEGNYGGPPPRIGYRY